MLSQQQYPADGGEHRLQTQDDGGVGRVGTALADRMFHFNVQTVIDAFLAHALACGFAPEVMAYLKVRPDRLDDTPSQLANDHLVGASPRWIVSRSRTRRSGGSPRVSR